MATTLDTAALRLDLASRRVRLGRLRDPNEAVRNLLAQVDAALREMDEGTFGACDVCHDSVEASALAADPLCRVCLDHFSAEERRRLEDDLERARRVQANLLPERDVRMPGWEIHTRYTPAGPVSGDYYDVLRRDDGGALVLFGDVAGKGVSASLLMASLQAIFKSLTSVPDELPDLLGRANRLFCESTGLHSFATLVCVDVLADGGVGLANAGHWPPLVRSRTGVAGFPAEGLPIGLFADAAYPCRRLELSPGDALVLYTDGLSEARNRDGEEYGNARLAGVLAETAGLPAAVTAERLLADLAAFQGPARPADDLTLMVLQRTA